MKVRWWPAGTIFVPGRIQSRGQPCAYYYGLEKDGDGDSDDDDVGDDDDLRVRQQYNDDDDDHHHHLRKLSASRCIQLWAGTGAYKRTRWDAHNMRGKICIHIKSCIKTNGK